MQQLLKAPREAAGAEIVPTELLSQLLFAVHDPQPAPNLRLGRVSHTCAYLSARKEGRFSHSPCVAMAGLLSTAWPLGQGRRVSQKPGISAGGRRPSATGWPSGKGWPETVGPTAGTPSFRRRLPLGADAPGRQGLRPYRLQASFTVPTNGILSIPLRRFGDSGALRVR